MFWFEKSSDVMASELVLPNPSDQRCDSVTLCKAGFCNARLRTTRSEPIVAQNLNHRISIKTIRSWQISSRSQETHSKYHTSHLPPLTALSQR